MELLGGICAPENPSTKICPPLGPAEGPASADCNGNSIPDECEIAAGTAIDNDGNGLIDACECAAADLDNSGDVGITDFLALLGAWGTDPGGPPDLNGDGDVGIEDLLALLAQWGECG